MPSDVFDFDVAVVGGGPAGLSASILLGRSCRRVVLFDHGQPRNYAATAVHGYLGLNGITPSALRERGRREAESYGVKLIDSEVTAARWRNSEIKPNAGFFVTANGQSLSVRALLLATGMIDEPPSLPNFDEFYGRSIHHCPYCDGWEHHNESLIALASGEDVVKLALTLRCWSEQITACTNGSAVSCEGRMRLKRYGISCREEIITDLIGTAGHLTEVSFSAGPAVPCEALFFGGEQRQRSSLPRLLGCELDEHGLITTKDKHETCIAGLFVAGDVDSETQFAIVAAAEGAVAATAINRFLSRQELDGCP